MKNGKKPTVKQSKRIASYNLDYNDWLVVKDYNEEFLIIHRESGETRSFSNINGWVMLWIIWIKKNCDFIF